MNPPFIASVRTSFTRRSCRYSNPTRTSFRQNLSSVPSARNLKGPPILTQATQCGKSTKFSTETEQNDTETASAMGDNGKSVNTRVSGPRESFYFRRLFPQWRAHFAT